MSRLIAEFYKALLLIGLTVTVIVMSVNRSGELPGLALNAVLVLRINAFFV